MALERMKNCDSVSELALVKPGRETEMKIRGLLIPTRTISAFAATVFAAVFATAAQSQCVLGPNQVLSQNQTIRSCSNGFTLAMQGDGNLVLYNSAGSPLWQSHTYNPGSPNRATRAVMQSDGNFVLYNDSNVAQWATMTQGNPNASLSVQGDGNLVVYSQSGQPLWDSGTCCPNVSVTGVWSDAQVFVGLFTGPPPDYPIFPVYDNFTLTIRPNGTYSFASIYEGNCSGTWAEHGHNLVLSNGFCHGALDTTASFSGLDLMTYGFNPFYVPPTGPQPLNWVHTGWF
jgi:hypothetical protein